MSNRGRKAINTADDDKIGGLNVFRDDKNRPVYWNRRTKVGYVLTEQTKLFRTYSSRFIIGILAMILTYMFNLPWYVCVIIGIVSWAIMEFKFRQFLSRLPQIANFKPVNNVSRIEAESNLDHSKIIIKCILLVLLVVLLPINAYQQKYEGVILYLNFAIIAFVVVLLIMEVRALILAKKK